VSPQNNFSSAICVSCQAAERGEVLPKEIEDQLRVRKMPDGKQLPESVFTENIPDPMVDSDEKVVGTEKFWHRAIVGGVSTLGKIMYAVVKKKKKAGSKKLAEEKRRKPVLEGGVEINIKKNKPDE
jgi:hypothetical protein